MCIRDRLGTGDDFQIYHNGSGNFIDVYTNHLQFRTAGTTELIAEFKLNNSVDLYYDGTKRIETTSNGAKVSGENLTLTSTADVDLNLIADTDNNDETHNPSINFLQDGGSQHLKIGIEGNAGSTFTGSGANTSYIITTTTTNLQLGTNNNARWTIAASGHLFPVSNGALDIGTTSNRVRNLYTSDLHICLLYTSPSPRDLSTSRMPSSA